MNIGDLHLEKMTNLFGDNSVARQIKAITMQLEVAREYKCKHIAMLGDIFDSPYPSQHTMRDFIRLLNANKEFEFLIYSGNHDRDDVHTCSLDLLQTLPEIGALRNVTFITKPTLIKWGDAKAYVMPWTKQSPKLDGADFVFFHDAIAGAARDNGSIYERGMSRAIFKGKPAIGGDLHTFQRIKNVLYPGTPVYHTFGDKAKRRLIVSEFRHGQVKHLEAKWNPPWHLKTVTYDPTIKDLCNEPNTYYRLLILPDAKLPNTWLIDHPQVLQTDGTNKTKKTKEVLETAKADTKTEKERLAMFLNKNTNLTSKQVNQALLIDNKLSRL